MAVGIFCMHLSRVHVGEIIIIKAIVENRFGAPANGVHVGTVAKALALRVSLSFRLYDPHNTPSVPFAMQMRC
jgi:hypothetical protein